MDMSKFSDASGVLADKHWRLCQASRCVVLMGPYYHTVCEWLQGKGAWHAGSTSVQGLLGRANQSSNALHCLMACSECTNHTPRITTHCTDASASYEAATFGWALLQVSSTLASAIVALSTTWADLVAFSAEGYPCAEVLQPAESAATEQQL
jgi:hypothetical protein